MFNVLVTPARKLPPHQLQSESKHQFIGGAYSQNPGLASGPSAVVVHMSNITPAAPPCMTPLIFVYRSSIRNSKVTVPFGEASISSTVSMMCLSNPANFVEVEMRR